MWSPPRYLLLALVLALAGCAHKVTEKDLVGRWTPDPESVKAAKGNAAEVLRSSTLTLTEDKSYGFDFRSVVQLKGTWTLQDTSVSLDPGKVILTFPQLPGGKLEMTPDELLTKVGPILKQSANGAEQLKVIEAISHPIVLKVSPDGKTMTSSDNESWKKQETGG